MKTIYPVSKSLRFLSICIIATMLILSSGTAFVEEVNNPPVLHPMDPLSIDEGSLVRFSVLVMDPDGDEVTVTASDLPSGATFNEPDRYLSFVWEPDYDQAGVYEVTFTATDEHGETDTESITITVRDVIQPPTVKSIEYNVSHDFLEDLVLDDAEIVWQAVEAAAQYKVAVHYTSYGFGNEFVIPGSEVINLGNGDLKFIWVDYGADLPEPIPYPIDGVALRAIDETGNESGLSNTVYLSPIKAVIYGQVTDANTGNPIEEARLHIRTYNPHHGIWADHGDFYTDAGGMYYFIGGYGRASSGAYSSTHIDVFKEGYESSLDNTLTLYEPTQVERFDIALKKSDMRLDTDLPGAADSLNPQIVSDEKGNVYSVWEDSRNGLKDIYFNYSLDKGATWQDEDTRLDIGDEAGAAASLNPKITCDENGHVYVVWQDARNGREDIYIRYAAMDESQILQWNTAEIRLDTGLPGGESSTNPAICTDGKGSVYVVWEDTRNKNSQVAYGLYANYSHDYGETWLAEDIFMNHDEQVYMALDPQDPKIRCDDNGNVYITWWSTYYSSYRTCAWVNFKYSHDFGANWSNIQRITNDIYESRPDMNCDNKGNVYLTWLKSETIKFIHSQDYGETWSGNTLIGDSSYYIMAQIDCDETGHVYITWEDPNHYTGNPYVYFDYSHDFGTTWHEDTELDVGDGTQEFVARNPRVNSDNNGNVYVVWQNNPEDSYDIYFNYSQDLGVTWQDENMRISDKLDGTESVSPQFSSDNNGNVYVVWSDNRDVKYDIYFDSLIINMPPQLDPIGDKEVEAYRYLYFFVSATDPNGDDIALGVDNLPEGAYFWPMDEYYYSLYKTYFPDLSYPCAIFYWRPRADQIGEHNVTFWAEDLEEGTGNPKERTTEHITITVKEAPNTQPWIWYIRNYYNMFIIWRGYDREDGYNLEYSYRIDSGAWSSWTRRIWIYLPYLSQGLKSGWHSFQVKARDSQGLESYPRATSFEVIQTGYGQTG